MNTVDKSRRPVSLPWWQLAGLSPEQANSKRYITVYRTGDGQWSYKRTGDLTAIEERARLKQYYKEFAVHRATASSATIYDVTDTVCSSPLAYHVNTTDLPIDVSDEDIVRKVFAATRGAENLVQLLGDEWSGQGVNTWDRNKLENVHYPQAVQTLMQLGYLISPKGHPADLTLAHLVAGSAVGDLYELSSALTDPKVLRAAAEYFEKFPVI